MQLWNEILATAVVGTEQREFKFAPREDELGSLLAQIDNTDREGSLLTAASVVTLYRSAGVAPVADTHPSPEVADQDEASRANAASGQHLALMLAGAFREVLPEWLAAMSQAGKRVPEEHLPALLDLGRADISLRRLIVAVMGRRGEWLAAQNPEWSYATQREEKELWETGSREERLLLLEHLRTVDPTRARELLATTWSQESAKDRTAFLEKFATGVDCSDEPFCNEALNDRSVEVRRVARSLLASLPNSELSRRLQALADQVVSFRKPLLGKARIEVTLPEDPIAWLKANGVEIDSPPPNASNKLGPKAWALKEMVSLIPVTHWNELWNKTALEIARAAGESEWRDSFNLGFVIATRRDRDPDWIEALLQFMSTDPTYPQMIALAAYLPAARLEALILAALKSEQNELNDIHASRLLSAHRSSWSDHFSRAVVNSVKQQGNLVTGLKQYARYVSPALYDELASGWPTESEWWSNWSKFINDFLALLAFRRDMHRAISEKEQNS
jgi:hypothetical protein